MKRKSQQEPTNQILGMLSIKEIKSFLMDCVNLPNPIDYPKNHSQFDRWLKRWQRLFTYQIEAEGGKRRPTPFARESLESFVPKVRTGLRRIWYEKDARQRDWYFYRLRDEYQRIIVSAENPHIIDFARPDAANRLLKLDRVSRKRKDNSGQRARFFETWAGRTDLLDDAPTICPFEAAVYWLQINQKLMVYCAGPVCAAVLFRTEKGQKYCSPECADPARREAKLKWWNENRRTK